MTRKFKKKTNSYLITVFIFFAFLNSVCFSQTVQDSSQSHPAKSFISTVAGDISYVAVSPFHMSKIERIEFVSLIALSVGLVYGVDGGLMRN
jgi:hypothetical protein